MQRTPKKGKCTLLRDVLHNCTTPSSAVSLANKIHQAEFPAFFHTRHDSFRREADVAGTGEGGDGGEATEAIGVEAITATELGRKTRASRRGDAVSDARRRRRAEDRRGRSAAAVRRRSDERTRCEFLPHRCTHTHTRPSPARHARPPRTLHQLGATPTASPPPSPHAQVETTDDSARTCRSCGRTDRVGARIGRTHVGWAHRSGAQVCVWMWVGMREENGSCVAGRSVPRTVGEQDDQCAGRSIMGVAPTLGMDSCCV